MDEQVKQESRERDVRAELAREEQSRRIAGESQGRGGEGERVPEKGG